jgi:hypothetical protein
MNLFDKFGARHLLAGLALLGACTTAHAQATRTWVSGVGDDVNPCSRTAPCKTFAGAISKTSAGGEISVLDPGGFGAVTITKSITIDGGGIEGSILSGATTGVLVNGAGINVVLRNLRINGAASSTTPTEFGRNGVRFINGASVTIDHCHISNFKYALANYGNGVMVEPTAAGTYRLHVINSTIVNNGWGNDGGGVRLRPTGASTFAFATIQDSDIINNNGYGVLSRDRSFVTVSGSNISGNLRSGVNLLTTGTIGETVVRDSILADNGSVNAGSEAGVTSNGAASFVHITGNTIVQSENGLRRINGGHISSSGDNRVGANTADGTTDGAMTSL